MWQAFLFLIIAVGGRLVTLLIIVVFLVIVLFRFLQSSRQRRELRSMYCIPLKGLCFDKLILCLNFISIVFVFKIYSYWCVCVTSSRFLLNRADESFTNSSAFIGSKVGVMIDVKCLTVLVIFSWEILRFLVLFIIVCTFLTPAWWSEVISERPCRLYPVMPCFAC